MCINYRCTTANRGHQKHSYRWSEKQNKNLSTFKSTCERKHEDKDKKLLRVSQVKWRNNSSAQTCQAGLHFHFVFKRFFFLLGVKSLGPSPTLEGSVQNLELKFCSRATVKCASGTVGAVKVCARTPGVCSCALLKLYCLCRRERVRPTRLFFYFVFFYLFFKMLLFVF